MEEKKYYSQCIIKILVWVVGCFSSIKQPQKNILAEVVQWSLGQSPSVQTPCEAWAHPRPSQTLLWKIKSYLLISVSFWIMPPLIQLTLTFFLQDKVISLEHITKQKINCICLLGVECLSLGLNPVVPIDLQATGDTGKWCSSAFCSYLILYSGS